MKFYENHYKPPTYFNDGCGRDTYISFFNGGFSNYPYGKIQQKDSYGSYHSKFFPDLSLKKQVIKYGADGSGRDYFINQHTVSEPPKILGDSYFQQTLRKNNFSGPIRTSVGLRNNTFEKRLIGRVFYGKCPGVKERLMCPKTNFNKKKELKISLSETALPEINNLPKSLSNLEHIEKKKYNIRVNEEGEINKILGTYEGSLDTNNKIEDKKEKEMFRLRKMKRKKDNASNDNIIRSLRSIYLFNQKKGINSLKDI